MGRRSRHPYSTQDGRPICFQCKEAGHIARDCASIEENCTKEMIIVTCIFRGPNPKSGVLIGKVRCLDRDIEPVLSTCSTASVMSKELWHELNCPLLPWNKSKVVNIIGQEMEHIGVAQLRMTLDGHEAIGLVFVIVDAAVDLILGQNFLNQWGLRIKL